MTHPIDIALLAFDGMQILDITGPAAVFAAANDACGRSFYRVHILSATGGPIQSNSAVSTLTTAIKEMPPQSVHTLLVVGGDVSGLRQLAAMPSVRSWVMATAAVAQRFGSVCSGALVLGSFGLLDGKRVTTHWHACAALTQQNPEAKVDMNALYIEDGRVWTSAGVTTGIDMCLAIVEKDLGSAVTHAVAERLVLYARRPGYQSQFSPILSAQARAGTVFADLIEWMKDNLTKTLDVPDLAARVAMSGRSFHRKFTNAIGETPAHFVETLRLDHSRHLLAANLSLKEIAAKTGFSTAAQFTKAFERRFGVTPGFFRELHR
jgi:transcriptional regulator GlxA family with amidase domain